jgi:sorbitol-specific phosphotransferase system component IIC
MIQEKVKIFFRRFSEAMPACLMVMVQGNPLALSLGHWLKACQTGAIAGLIMVGLSCTPRKDLMDNKYTIAGLTGFVTALADYFVHPTHFGGEFTEALVTGIAAGLLCLAFSGLKKEAK